jgi:hypothetical protein
MESEEKDNRVVIELLVLILLGFGFLLVGTVGYSFELTMLFLTLGIGFCFSGVLLFANWFRVNMKDLNKNKRGALYVWAVCLLAIVVLAMGWFTLSYPTFQIIEIIENIYSFPPEATAAIGLIKSVLGWFLILMSLGLIIWAFVASSRREDVTFPIG